MRFEDLAARLVAVEAKLANLTGTTVNTLFGSTLSTLSTTITVIGRDSGARITVPINVAKVSTL
jgi:hypothetical protein